jgi:hypothetical protein
MCKHPEQPEDEEGKRGYANLTAAKIIHPSI